MTPLVAPLAKDQAGPQARELFDKIAPGARPVINIFATMGHAPEVLRHTLGLNEAIKHELPANLRELAYLAASRINQCGYCEHYHQGFARQAGVSDAKIKDVLALGGVGYTEVERLAVRFAQEWTRDGKASAEVVEALKQHLSPAQLITLAATVGLANWTNRFNETFGVQLP
jgi:AhpD family alkylhydroperoxidase